MELEARNCPANFSDLCSSKSSSHSSSLSSIEFKMSLSSSSSSLPSSSQFGSGSGSSIDSALAWLHTSCVLRNFPYKSLHSRAIDAKSTALVASSQHLLLLGTESHGLLALSKNPDDSLHSPAMGGGGGSVKAILELQNRVLSAHQDGKIRVWKIRRQEHDSKMIHEPLLEITDTLPTTKDVLARSLLPSSYIQVRRHHQKLWIQHADAVSCLASSKDLVISGSWDRSLKIWRARDWKCLESLRGAHDDAINAVVAHDRESLVYTAAADGKIKAWELSHHSSSSRPWFFSRNRRSRPARLSLLAVLERHRSAVNALELDSASGYLYSASSDGSIGVWEREDTALHMAAVDALRGHSKAVLCLALADLGDGRVLLCSGSADKTIRVWTRDRLTGIHSCLCVIRGHQAPVKAVAIACSSRSLRVNEGATVVSGGLDCQLRTWWVSLDGSSAPEDREESSR